MQDIFDLLVAAGSSPLTRGKLAFRATDDEGGGLIPAHAGKTTEARPGLCRS